MFAQAMNTAHLPEEEEIIAVTENQARSYATTARPFDRKNSAKRVNFWFKVVRKLPKIQAQQLLTESWLEDPLDTLKIVFQGRDCRGGKGEREIFHYCLEWLIERYPEHILKNMQYIPSYGRWDDIIRLFPTKIGKEAVQFYANQLREDIIGLKRTDREISLAAKWAPTEGGKYDKKFKAAKLLAEELECTPRQYRVRYLTPLRNYLKIVETYMCSKNWFGINYNTVPGCCMHKNKKTFEKRDEERFKAWKERLSTGDKSVKVNSMQGQMHPHEILKSYFNQQFNCQADQIAEEQWNQIREKVHSMGSIGSSIWLADMSGSMSGDPMMVAMALSLLGSELTAPPFQNMIMTFSTNPQFYQIQGNGLYERAKYMYRGMAASGMWGGSTNFEAAYMEILRVAAGYMRSNGRWVKARDPIPPEEMPKRFYILSDMQFNMANSSGNFLTNYETMEMNFRRAGYPMPELVFWNLRGNTLDYPAGSEDKGIAMVSGFSPSILKAILAGEEMTPVGIMRKALDDPRYDQIRLCNNV